MLHVAQPIISLDLAHRAAQGPVNSDVKPHKNAPLKLLYADTNSLIYAYEKERPEWRAMFDELLSSGYRLSLTEENLLEFAQSPTPEAASCLARRVMELNPVWLRSFIDIQCDEVRAFVEQHGTSDSIPAPEIYRSTFESVSQIGDSHRLGPIQFVELFASETAKPQVQQLRREHASVLDVLTRATASRVFTKGHEEAAFRTAISARLSRGSDLTAPMGGEKLDEAVRFCIKHRKWLLRTCPSFAAENHLTNYRSSSPKRNARLSDAVDLTTTVVALPYVDAVITNDGFLYYGLDYVKRKMPSIRTELILKPKAL